MGWSKLFKFADTPDKDDPKYKERYEQMHAAGGKFARVTGITWLGRQVTFFANNHKKLFLVLVLGFAFFVLALQMIHLVNVIVSDDEHIPVTERVDSVLQDRFKNSNNVIERYEKED